MDHKEIENKIRSRLDELGMSITDLAEGLGVTRANVYRKFSLGQYTVEDLDRIAKVLDCELSVELVRTGVLIYRRDDNESITLGSFSASRTVSVDEALFMADVDINKVMRENGLATWDSSKLSIIYKDSEKPHEHLLLKAHS